MRDIDTNNQPSKSTTSLIVRQSRSRSVHRILEVICPTSDTMDSNTRSEPDGSTLSRTIAAGKDHVQTEKPTRHIPDLIGARDTAEHEDARSFPEGLSANHDEYTTRPRIRRKSWWLAGTLVLIVVVLAAVLGGVLGTKAHRKVTSSSTGTVSDSMGSFSSAQRIQSPGAWNGTSLTVFADPLDLFKG